MQPELFCFLQSPTALKGRMDAFEEGGIKANAWVLTFCAFQRSIGTEPRLSNLPGSLHNSGARLICFCIFCFSRRVGIVIAGLLGFSASAPISASYDDSPCIPPGGGCLRGSLEASRI